MANTIKIKNSGTTSNVPSSLEHGELAINYADGLLFYKNSSNVISQFSSGGGASVTISDTAPSSPSSGDLWYESDTGDFFVYYDGYWVELGADPPSSSFLSDLDGDTLIQVEESNDEDKIRFDTAGSERMIIDNAGNVGIGTTSPDAQLEVSSVTGAGTSTTELRINADDNSSSWSTTNPYARLAFSTSDGSTGGPKVHTAITATSYDSLNHRTTMTFQTSEDATGVKDRMSIDPYGKVGIGTTDPPAQLTVQAASTGLDDGTVEFHKWIGTASSPSESEDWPTPVLALRAFDNFSTINMLSFGYSNDAVYQTGSSVWSFRLSGSSAATASASGTTNLNLVGPGTFNVNNFTASGTKSFTIAHPLAGLRDTHDLRHSVVESPRADNVYRGSVVMDDGVATVNLDEAAGMTEGTFVLLNRDVQCFTSNENGWTAVRGSVAGNVLTIEAQDSTCVDTVSWLVVGERQDDEIKASPTTDAEGHLIVEALTQRVSEADIAESEARMEAAREAARIEALEAN